VAEAPDYIIRCPINLCIDAIFRDVQEDPMSCVLFLTSTRLRSARRN